MTTIEELDTVPAFVPDEGQRLVLEHERGPLLVSGAAGTGKTVVLRERFARLVEGGADPERVGLVVRTKSARRMSRAAILDRLRRALPDVRVMTVHALAYHTLSLRFDALGYERPPEVLTAFDQFARVRELLQGEDPVEWPAFAGMLRLRGFADGVRQFVLRAQESLVDPAQLASRAGRSGTSGWLELAEFYRRYLDVLGELGAVDFAGLVVQAAAAAGRAEPLFDHLLVDDYQEATFSEESLIVHSMGETLVVAGDLGSHVYSFQGTTDEPLRAFVEHLPNAGHVELRTRHRSPQGATVEAWSTAHTSEEHAAIARELRRVHIEDGVAWRNMAVVVRRQGSHLGGLVRALDDAGVPRVTPEGGLSLLGEPATFPYLLALRWLARPAERDGLVESVLTSELARLSPAAARGLVRAARAAGDPPWRAVFQDEGLDAGEAAGLASLREVLAASEAVAGRSALDAFATLWRELPYSRRLVQAADVSQEARRSLAAVLTFADSVSRADEGSDRSVGSFLDLLEAGEEGPGLAGEGASEADAVRVLTAHATAGLEFDTVIVAGAMEGNFPSLSRPEPLFDLAMLQGRTSQSERNRLRLKDERRLFDVVLGRARRRVLLMASDPHGEDAGLAARSRFVAELGIHWRTAPAGPFPDPLSVAEAAAAWRRRLADAGAPAWDRLAALTGLVSLPIDPRGWWFQRDWTASDRPLHEQVRTSYSKLSTLENCELQYVLGEELGLEDRAGYHAWVGHLVHRIIEDCENGLVERTTEALVAAAEHRWREQEFPSHAVSDAFRRLVVGKMLPDWFRHYGSAEALAVEVRFQFESDGATVTGYIDRIGRAGGGTLITDYKTGRAADVLKPEENLQLGMYYLAVNRAEELAAFRPVKAVELAYLRDPPKRNQAAAAPFAVAQLPITDRVRGEYEQLMTERLGGLIGRLGELLESESYRPSPAANCWFCRFKTLCPLFPEGGELFPIAEGPR